LRCFSAYGKFCVELIGLILAWCRFFLANRDWISVSGHFRRNRGRAEGVWCSGGQIHLEPNVRHIGYF